MIASLAASRGRPVIPLGDKDVSLESNVCRKEPAEGDIIVVGQAASIPKHILSVTYFFPLKSPNCNWAILRFGLCDLVRFYSMRFRANRYSSFFRSFLS